MFNTYSLAISSYCELFSTWAKYGGKGSNYIFLDSLLVTNYFSGIKVLPPCQLGPNEVTGKQLSVITC